MTRLRARGGYTLPEVLMYGVVLAAIVNLCSALYLSGRRVYDLGELSITRTDALRDMETDLREAASRADAIADRVEGLDLPNVVLVLRGTSSDGATTYAVWRQGEHGALIFETYESRNGSVHILRQQGYQFEVTATRASPFGKRTNLVEFAVSVKNIGTRRSIPETNVFIARIGGGGR